jgi:hypothetical protein
VKKTVGAVVELEAKLEYASRSYGSTTTTLLQLLEPRGKILQ